MKRRTVSVEAPEVQAPATANEVKEATPVTETAVAVEEKSVVLLTELTDGVELSFFDEGEKTPDWYLDEQFDHVLDDRIDYKWNGVRYIELPQVGLVFSIKALHGNTNNERHNVAVMDHLRIVPLNAKLMEDGHHESIGLDPDYSIFIKTANATLKDGKHTRTGNIIVWVTDVERNLPEKTDRNNKVVRQAGWQKVFRLTMAQKAAVSRIIDNRYTVGRVRKTQAAEQA